METNTIKLLVETYQNRLTIKIRETKIEGIQRDHKYDTYIDCTQCNTTTLLDEVRYHTINYLDNIDLDYNNMNVILQVNGNYIRLDDIHDINTINCYYTELSDDERVEILRHDNNSIEKEFETDGENSEFQKIINYVSQNDHSRYRLISFSDGGVEFIK